MPSAKAPACCRAELLLPLGTDLCNQHRAILLAFYFQLGCSDTTKGKIWSAVYLLLETMCIVERRQVWFFFFSLAQVESAGRQLEKTPPLYGKLMNFPWMPLGENKHRAP